jgi:hypothetical protein
MFTEFFRPVLFKVIRLTYKPNFNEEIEILAHKIKEIDFQYFINRNKELNLIECQYDNFFYGTFILAAVWYKILYLHKAMRANGYFNSGDIWSYNVHFFLYYCSLATLVTKYSHLLYYHLYRNKNVEDICSKINDARKNIPQPSIL